MASGTDVADNPDAVQPEGADPPDALQRFIFYRELAEVYLLLDNISTTLGKSLPLPRPANRATGDPGERDWVEDICKIGWPPKGSPSELDHQAAVLIKARDRLNTVASPATGYTIAFTVLVAGEQTRHIGAGRRSRRAREIAGADAMDESATAFLRGNGQGQPPPSRFLLANIAYPGLQKLAYRFVVFKYLLLLGLFLLFLMTSVLSWNIATGNLLLAQWTALQSVTTTKTIGGPSTTGSNSHPASGDACNGDIQCERRQQSLAVAEGNLRHWSDSWHFLNVILPDMNVACSTDPRSPTGCPPANEQWISTFLSILGGAVLPIFYGALGAGVAVVRSLSDKVRDSRLAPRDLTLFLVQLVLGAVLGGCIGLFATPSSTASGQTAGLLDKVPLSASALCFLAGFSVDGVFRALDNFIRRVFNLPDPSKPASPPPPPPPIATEPVPAPSPTPPTQAPPAPQAGMA